MLISEIMSGPVHTIGFDQTVALARQRMQMHDVRHLVVLRGGQIQGVVSDRDLALVEGVMGGNSTEVPVEEVMSAPAYTVAKDQSAAGTLAHMATHRLGTAVVLDASEVVGIVTTTDAVRVLAEQLAAKG